MASTTSLEDRRPTSQGPPAAATESEVPVGWIAAAVFVTILVAFLWVTRIRDGEFTYPLDDSYIHLRLGANLAHGTLGMNPGEFASASSSPIWPVLIAAAALVTGPLVGIPLLLATSTGVVTLVLVDRWARARAYSVTERAVLLTALILVIPLTSIALTGMEHTLQIGGTLLLISLVVDRVDRVDRLCRADLAIFGAAALCAATRLETLFLVVPLGALLATHRHWRTLVVLSFGSLLPVAVVAAVNLGQGWPALPASVLIKASGAQRTVGPAVLLFFQTRLFLVMCLALLLCWFGRHALGAAWPPSATRWTAVVISASILNVAAGLGVQLHRYEAYLVAACVMSCSVNAHVWSSARRGGTLPAPMPFVARGVAAVLAALAVVFGSATLPEVSNGMQEVHLQQVQMARFSAAACPGCTVVLNDIGQVAFDGDVRIVDDVGLANLDVLEAKRAGTYDSQRLDQIATSEGATLAMIYPGWKPGPPDAWDRIGSWQLAETRVVGGAEVVFYSLDPSRTDDLRRALADFEVPPEVRVSIDA